MLQCGDYHSQVIVLVNVVTFYASCFCHFTCNVQHLLSNHCPVRLKSTSVLQVNDVGDGRLRHLVKYDGEDESPSQNAS